MRFKGINNKQKKIKQEVGSLLVIIILVCSGLLIMMHTNSKFSMAIEVPSSTEKADNDFINGTLNNLTIVGIGAEAELRLNSSDSWEQKNLSIKPKRRVDHAMAPIYGTNKILLFGGYSIEGSINYFFNDTWLYDFNRNEWINKTSMIRPAAGWEHEMAPIHGTDKVLLFTGVTGGPSTGNPATWVFDLSEGNWTKKSPNISPGIKVDHSIASIWGTDKVLLFGGSLGAGYFDETWVYDLSKDNWTKKIPINKPSPRRWHTLASIFRQDKVLLFGGQIGKNPYIDDETWVYDLSDNNWTNKTNSIKPKAKMWHEMTSIYGTDKVMLFGGFSGGPRNDTWIYDLSENTWTLKMHSISPSNRILHDMANIYGTNKVVLFSGRGGIYENDTWIYHLNLYEKSGSYISNPYYIGQNFTFKTIKWVSNISINTSITFQLRSSANEDELNSKDFVGPDGTTKTYYLYSSSDIWSGHNIDSWIQYKAYLSTKNVNETPRLKNVTLIYNYLPNTTLIDPNNGSIKVYNKPTFEWNFTDHDSKYQSAFQVLIDDDLDFTSIEFDSGKQNSNISSWQFPNGTSYSTLYDGIWYWKARTKDNDGDWGIYSSPWKFTIDSKAPKSKVRNPENNRFYKSLDTITGEAFDVSNGSGLNKIEIKITHVDDNSSWDGTNWSAGEFWLQTIGTNNWSYDSNKVTWTSGCNYNVRSRATDNAFNVEIPNYGNNFIYDSENVTFSNPFPLADEVSPNKNVMVGITISDSTSGVNSSTIEYSISKNEGNIWSYWKSADYTEDNNIINITLNLSFTNGTGNRIKWRACDVAGNGPNESNSYQINIDTWQKKISKPKVQLWTPPNSSIIPITSVELTWRLESIDAFNITYNVFLDTVYPPIELNKSNLLDTSLKVTGLSTQQTYYWTVIPRFGKYNGTCESGVWSFTVDVPIPKVKLLTPENGSIINSIKPTLSWSVDYTGTEILKYDVYLDTREDPGIEHKNYTSKYYLPKRLLENGKTYYWKVVPWAGDTKGLESEIWSFSVDEIDEMPRFDLELRLEPSVIELEPGSIKYVIANVTNLGDLTDSISVKVITPPNVKLGVFVNEPSTRHIVSGDNADFNLTIVTLEDAKKGEIIIEVVASSNKALEYDLVVEKQDKLMVRILEGKKTEPEKTSYLFVFLNILILIIIIIIILAIAIYIHKRKKKEEEEEQEKAAPEAVMVKPGELPTAEISIGSAPKPEQLPKTTEPEKVTEVISPEVPKPQLPGTTPRSETTEALQTPLLPAVQDQEIKKEDNVSTIIPQLK